MNLYLTSRQPWRSEFSTSDGQVLYKAYTPRYSWGGEHITISRLQPSNSYAAMAEIEYHPSRPFGSDSKIKFGKANRAAKDILHKQNWNLFGYGERVFCGPDGRKYVWKMSSHNCSLKDESKTPIATFHLPRPGFLSGSLPVFLEVSPCGIYMMDYILTTFIYMERLRTERRKRLHMEGGFDAGDGGGGGS